MPGSDGEPEKGRRRNDDDDAAAAAAVSPTLSGGGGGGDGVKVAARACGADGRKNERTAQSSISPMTRGLAVHPLDRARPGSRSVGEGGGTKTPARCFNLLEDP